MYINEKTGWRGLWSVTVNGNTNYYENVITKIFRAELNKVFAGETDSVMKLQKQQLGTDSTLVTTDDESMGAPDVSTLKNITSMYTDGITLGVTATWGFGEAEGSWSEFGLWAGEDSDILAVHLNLDETVPANSSITIDGVITQSHNED